MTEHAEIILNSSIFESVAIEVAEMFSQYSNSKLWVK